MSVWRVQPACALPLVKVWRVRVRVCLAIKWGAWRNALSCSVPCLAFAVTVRRVLHEAGMSVGGGCPSRVTCVGVFI